jgi:pimeloyl-ACP methyl ester carboxylesterase
VSALSPALPAPPSAHPVYLDADSVKDPIFGFLHMPADGEQGEIAVLLCPPFGWEDICSYRSRRDWAEHLAAAGHPTLRIDLPGAGDSGGSPEDPRRLAAWTETVGSSAGWLRATSGCHRVVAIGIGLGGLVICRAIAAGAPIDEIVLWAVPSRGRNLLRELRTFARLEASASDAPDEHEPSPLPEGSTGVGGFVLSAETVQALEELDLTTLALPTERIDRALLLERDGIAVDARLRDHLAQSGAAVTIASGAGYGAMMAKPHLARSPTDVFARVLSWLDEMPPSTAPPAPIEPIAREHRTVSRRDTIELTVAGARINETPLTVAQPLGDLFGILAEPVDAPPADLCAVLLNAGAIRRIGPNRMWVEIARRWAARGVPTLRLDLEGIGDAGGDGERFTELAELYAPGLVDQLIAALDELGTRGSGRRFVLTGLCSGACWSFHGALRDERVVAAFMLNPQALFWDPLLEAARDFRRGVLRVSSWRSVLRGEVPLARIAAFARHAPLAIPRRAAARWSAQRAGEDELDWALDQLRDTGKHLQFIFSGNEPLYEELELDGRLKRLDRWPNIGLELIPGRDHTLRPFQSQRHAHEALDRALDRELQRVAENASRDPRVTAVNVQQT